MRNRNSRLSLAVLVAFAMMAGACSCEGNDASRRDGEIDDSRFLPDPEKRADYLIDFGLVPLNAEPARQELELRNVGAAALTVQALAPEAPFSVTPADTIRLDINGAETVTFTYDPVEAGAHEHIATVSTSEGKMTFRLIGTGVTPTIVCEPTIVDFGGVELGVDETRSVTCTNETDAELDLRADKIAGNHAELFKLEGTISDGVKLPPGKPVTIPVVFKSQGLEGPRSANFKLWTGDAEVKPQIALKAESIAGALEVTPEPLAFGYIPEGATAQRALTVRNRGSRTIIVQKPVMDPGSNSAFTLEGAQQIVLKPEHMTTPELKENEAQIMVAFAPTTTGKLTGNVILKNDSKGSSVVTAAVEGNGGGPQITCTPGSIDFGVVAVDVPRTRSFVCTNTGTDDPLEDVADNLFISGVTSGMDVFKVQIDGGAGPNTTTGYAAGESFTVEVTYDPVATSSDSTLITVVSNDVLKPEVTVEVSGEGRALLPCNFTIAPQPRLDFHRVTPGNEATLQFAVINNDDHECVISDMAVHSDGGVEVFSINPLDAVTLPPSTPDGAGELLFPVTFSPPASANLDTATIFTGKVTFQISDPANPNQEVPLRGVSQKPCAEIIPAHINFGTTAPFCSTLERELIIRNICSDDIAIEWVQMNVGPSCPTTNDPNCEFGIRQYPPTGEVIPENGEVTFTMAYRPQNTGEDLGAVLVKLVGVDEPYTATLQGKGQHDAKSTDTFEQAERPKVDLLWVIDNSGSMGDEQTAIGANLSYFLDFAIAEAIDFQLGVTSSDTTTCTNTTTGHCGRLNPIIGDRYRDRILNANTPNLSTKWAAAVRTGTAGSATEKHLEGARMALAPGMIDQFDSPYGIDDGNRGFLRHDAALSIIFVSDEPDSSPLTTNDYLAFFQGIKGARNDNMLKIHGIIPALGCSGASSGADRFEALIDPTNGVKQPICTSDWEDSMREIGENAFGFSSRFFLTAHPACEASACTTVGADAEIVVEVDGVRVPPTYQGNWVWKYDRASNAVDFNPFYVPEAGSQINVTYTQICN